MFKKIISIVPIAMLSFTVASAHAAPITVEKGDTLWDLAREYNTSVKYIKSMNDLSSNLIHPGDVLAIAEKNKYVVKNGDSLWSIAKKFNLSVAQIKKWNQLKTETIQPGDALSLGVDYIVKDGDSLWNIARNFNTTVTNIKKYNQLSSDLIKPGLNLIIPENKKSNHSTLSKKVVATNTNLPQESAINSSSTNKDVNKPSKQEITTPTVKEEVKQDNKQEASNSNNTELKQEETIQNPITSTNTKVKEEMSSSEKEVKQQKSVDTTTSSKDKESEDVNEIKKNNTTLNESENNELTVEATAYTANCGGCSGVTSTGIDLKANPNAKVISVDPTVIPLGSKVDVEGYGIAIAGDTGSNIKGNKIDVFFSSEEEAQQFGRQTVKVKIVK